MEKADEEKLKLLREEICADVLFSQIAPTLVATLLATGDDIHTIKKYKSEKRRMEEYLDILPTKGPNAYRNFIEVLKEDYNWLSERLSTVSLPTPQPQNNAPSSSIQKPEGIDTPDALPIIINTNNNNQIQINENQEKLNTKINKEMISLLRKNYRVAQKWTTLAIQLDLDCYVQKIQRQINVYCEDPSICIDYLMKEWINEFPKQANLGNLIFALRENKFNEAADELEDRFLN